MSDMGSYVLGAVIGMACIAIGVFFAVKPDVLWRIQKANLEFWQGIRAEERTESWATWTGLLLLGIIGFGILILLLAWSGISNSQQYSATSIAGAESRKATLHADQTRAAEVTATP